MKANSLLSLTFIFLYCLTMTSSCIKEGCDDRISTDFAAGQEQWVPYDNVTDAIVFKKETEEIFDTLQLGNYEFKVITVQNTENCDKEETHELQRASLTLSSSPGTTEIALFQSSEDVGLFSITHDERELFFFYRELRFEIENDLYNYHASFDLNGKTYSDVLEITCNESIEACPNYKKLFYQKGGGLIGYLLNDAFWYIVE